MRILYLDLDTLRADHLSCYGYGRDTSPNIDWVANEGVRFNNYYCSDAPCLPSRAALMTGRFGIHNGVVNHGGLAADLRLEGRDRDFGDVLQRESLPAFLRRRGLRTVSVSPFAERHSAWFFYSGFNEMYNTGKCGNESAEEIAPVALNWIKNNAKQDNWFLHVNFWDPHTPLRAPKDFGNPFENQPLADDWITDEILKEHRSMASPHGAREIIMWHSNPNPRFPRQLGEVRDLKDVKALIDNYDCGINYMDKHIGMIFDALREQGVLDDTAIIISADHGENIGELGLYCEHGTADHVTCRIPMIIRWPNGKKGHVDNGFHYNLDLGPTFAELFDVEPGKSWDGQSYAKAVKEGADCGRDYLVVSQCAHVCQRSVRFEDWIYMRTYHDGFHLFDEEMLFNVKEDPHELNNRAKEHPELCRDAVYKLNEWHDNMMKTMDYDVDPLWTVMKEGGPYHARGCLEQYCERLEATERGNLVPELKRRHPQEFKK